MRGINGPFLGMLAVLAAAAPVATAGTPAPPARTAPASARADVDIPEPALPQQVSPVPLPPLHRTRLPNGLEVVIVERPIRPLVRVELTVPAGRVHDPRELPGLAGMVADMLTHGTRSRSAEAIAGAIESVGGSLEASAGVEATTITGQVLAEDLPLALELVADVAMRPSFPASEVEILRPRWLASARELLDAPEELASRYADHLLYGDAHPLGRLPSQRAAASVRAEDLAAFHRRHYSPRGALLLVVGDVDPARALDLIRQHLGAWQAPAGAPAAPAAPLSLAAPRPASSRIAFVEWPGQTQVYMELRQPGPAATVDDWPAVQAYNYVLGGGGFASRLMTVLRTQLGQTYGAFSFYPPYRFPSHLAISTFTRNETAWQALQVLRSLLEQFVREGVTPAELEDARRFLVFSYPIRLETLRGLSSTLFSALWLGRGPQWVSHYPVRVAALTLGEVNTALQRHLLPEPFAITLLGDPSVLERAPPAVWGVPRERIERVKREDLLR